MINEADNLIQTINNFIYRENNKIVSSSQCINAIKRLNNLIIINEDVYKFVIKNKYLPELLESLTSLESVNTSYYVEMSIECCILLASLIKYNELELLQNYYKDSITNLQFSTEDKILQSVVNNISEIVFPF
jgi:hypothetical protein